MSELKKITARLSETEPDQTGAEGVYATISNDFIKDEHGQPVYDKEYSYEMHGYFLHGPIPKDIRGGFKSAEEAEEAARREYKEWRAGNVLAGTMVTRQEYWEMNYRRDPYLQHLSVDELAERMSDVMNNLMMLTEDQKIGFISMDEAGDYWSAAFSHVLVEFGLRGGIPSNNLNSLVYPNYDWPGLGNAHTTFNAMELVLGQFLVKYSKLEYLKAALERGAIRISPASTYEDSSLNRAVRDNELELSIRPRPRSAKNVALEESSADLKTPVPPTGQVSDKLRTPTNYYVYCLAAEFALRLFADFEADACLVITKPRVFIERLLHAVLEQLPGWKGFGVGVKYIDPVNTTKEEIDVFYCKNFRYAYQKEYRLIWTPPSPEAALPYINVELGSLADCCELISLV